MPSPSATARLFPLARWSSVVALSLMGCALGVTVWTTYRAVVEASSTLVSGQANVLAQTVRSHLVALEGAPTSSDLATLLDEEGPTGLRYIAVLSRGGDVAAEAGRALGRPPLPSPGAPPEPLPPVGERRFRTALGALSRPGRCQGECGRWGGRMGLVVVVEFEPLEAETLRAAATRTLGVGALAAGTLLLVGGGLVRWVLGREALARSREREQRLASLGEMSAVLAHEIRNPLASLKGNAQLLAQTLPEGERTQQKASRVVEEALRLERLTDDLLAYVRTQKAHPEATAPGALLEACAQSVAQDASIQISTDGAPDTWRRDAARMRQVLVNLLENALLAGPPVKARVYTQGGRLVFEVQDAGPGVPEADRERIFEPFFTRRLSGTGLGLSVVKRVVELHQGTVTVEDGPLGGALFRVVLPP